MFKFFQAVGIVAALAGVVGLGVTLAQTQPNTNQAAPKDQPVTEQILIGPPRQLVPPSDLPIHTLVAGQGSQSIPRYFYSIDGSPSQLFSNRLLMKNATLAQVEAFITANPQPGKFLVTYEYRLVGQALCSDGKTPLPPNYVLSVRYSFVDPVDGTTHSSLYYPNGDIIGASAASAPGAYDFGVYLRTSGAPVTFTVCLGNSVMNSGTPGTVAMPPLVTNAVP